MPIDLDQHDATRWNGWFTMPGVTLGTSEDCAQMTNTNNKGYYATGNYMTTEGNPSRSRCQYFNRNCDMQSNGNCRSCPSNYRSQMAGGTCAHRVGGAGDEYPFYQGNCHHWWNRFPSAPRTEAKYCVAFKA